MKSCIEIFVCFCLMCSVGTPLFAENPRVLSVGYLSFRPFMFKKENGEAGGPFNILLKKMLTKAGYNFKFEEYPPKRLYKNIISGRVDIWPGINSIPELAGKTLACKTIISTVYINVYVTNNKQLPNTIVDLKGKKVIVIHGYGYGGLIDYILDPVNYIEVNSAVAHAEAFKMLKHNRSDYLIDYEFPSSQVLSQISIPGLRHNTIMRIPTQIILSKATPGVEEIIKKLDDVYAELEKTGEVEKNWREYKVK